MSEKIKFRAWDDEEKRFVFFDLIDLIRLTHGFGKKYKEIIQQGHVCRYTGTNTRDGKQIYEGDIVTYFGKSKNKNTDKEYLSKYYRRIVWKDGLFMTARSSRPFFNPSKILNGEKAWASNMTIVGNIYENPELFNEVDGLKGNPTITKLIPD